MRMRRFTSAPKPVGARLLVHVDDVAARHAQAVAHAVIAGEVGRGFGRRDDVIGGQGVFGVRQARCRRSRRRHPCSQAMPCCHSASISAGMPSTRYSFGMPMLHALHRAADGRLIIGNRHDRREVVSFGSWLAMELEQDARRRGQCGAIGPAWSSEEANATMPQREQRP